MPVFRKKDSRPYWDQLESEFDAGATMAAWLALSAIALVFGVVAWLVDGYVWPSLRDFLT
ncbi:MAG: hypothetical protein ACM3O5_00380 [Betaproteobacteria bacterium]